MNLAYYFQGVNIRTYPWPLIHEALWDFDNNAKKNPARRGVFLSYIQVLQLNDVLSRWTFFARDNFKADPSAFVQGFETISLDSGMMDENIRSSVLLDKTKPLGIVKPFYCSFSHFTTPLYWPPMATTF